MEKILDNAIPSTRSILFTGAGFTRNFGGYLARDMCAEIELGLPDKYCGILKKIKREFDYEKLFQTVMKGKYTREEKVAFNKCVLDVYKDMDEKIRGSVSNTPKLNFSINGIRSLLNRFVEKGKRSKNTSFFFTLNQDIYIERQFYNILTTLCVRTNNGIRSMEGKMQFQDYFSVV